jgi:hypothetical protein
MRRLLRAPTVSMVVLLALVLTAPMVTAGRLWCSADPVVTVDHRIVDISLAIPLEYLLLVNGPTVIEITTPASVDRQLLVNDVGFLHGSVVTFKDGGQVQDGVIPIRINASVSIDHSRLSPGETIPLRITVVVDDLRIAVVEGTTDKTTMDLVMHRR